MSAGTAEPAAALRRLRVDVADLVARAREGQARAVARLISLVEDASPQLREVAAALAPYAGSAQVIGLTGPPGVGKCQPRTAQDRCRCGVGSALYESGITGLR